MAYEYSLAYKICIISDDGLMKKPERNEGYGYRSVDDECYLTEADALEAVVKRDYRNCIIVRAVVLRWVYDE